MSTYLRYPLENGYIHNWLVLGPEAVRVADLDRFTGADFKLQIVRAYTQSGPGLSPDFPPAENAPGQAGAYQAQWRYTACRDDHFVDLTAFYHITHYLRAWAYAQVYCPTDRGAVPFTLTTNGPADVWINGQHVHRQEHFYHQIPFSVPFQAPLRAGFNEILVRVEEVAARECPFAMALRIDGLSNDVPDGQNGAVRLPTTIDRVQRRMDFEKIFAAAYLTQDVYHRMEAITVRWAADLIPAASVTARLQSLSNRIYCETSKLGRANNEAPLGHAVQYPDGEYRVVLMPRPKEYYEGNMGITRTLPVRIIRAAYSAAPYGTPEQRRQEALLDAAPREGSIFAEIAKMALGRWHQVETKTILKQIDSINQRADCSDFYLCGLLGMLYRFGDDPNFPAELRAPLEDCILNFKYWHDEPGSDAMCYTTENHSILFHTCQVLAGQRYPDRVFSNNGQTGVWHRQTGEARALAWLSQRARFGFLEWDSNTYFEEDVLALTHLADLADSEDVYELAAVVLDKLFFIMAVNSFKGTFGSTHGRTYTPFIKGGQFECTSGMQRIAFGMGVFNDRIMGSVSLACAQYEVPEIIAAIAADTPDELWNRERITADEDDFRSSGSRGSEVNKVTYKTPDYMLCSAQDWLPGQPGYQQHIWQATLSPDAVVFVTHPTCASEEGSHRPNFWHGNAILPRVAQWKDVLVAIHNFSKDDWMGFTHAYFPTYAFDETALHSGWAFARKGDGYLALWAANGLRRVERGDSAFHELRSDGTPNAWVCQMGRAAVDGSFAAFQERVLAQAPTFTDLELRWQTVRGQALRFGWEGPLTLDGVEQPITGFEHFDNPYCVAALGAPFMEIRKEDQILRLLFEKENEEE